jgi:hypothetical protein
MLTNAPTVLKFNPLPKLEELQKVFELTDKCQSALMWKIHIGSKKPGDFAGCLDKANNYWKVGLTLNGNKKTYFAHRIVFFLRTGINPGEYQIDHVSGDRSDNTNELRLVNHKLNSANQKPASTYKLKGTTSKYRGVWFRKESKKWESVIMVNGKNKYLGRFKCEHEAATAYNKAALEAWGEYAMLNKIEEDK